MRGFADYNHFYGADESNFLSANGKSRKEKRAAKKSAKEEKLRNKKGLEITNSINESLGLPTMLPKAEKKGIFSKLKDKRENKQADKLFKKDAANAIKNGTLTKATEPNKKSDLLGLKKTVLGLPSLLGMGTTEEKPALKKADSSQTIKYVILGLGVLALGAVLLSKGGAKESKK